ncbi:hypothetical protein F3Y22_tig00110330pilonHSYRG00184 [Hibiscus syriacus]|uniref:Uncharacterized protein n=1 Tax=Hibiscus syriacus TaxID=106335 RepID=A0A6A3B397_HIBSY|nr:hypothetical protein F3Y22_tig00110330pilonHSYRG00184 [Hibiscus syriacus]
MCISANGVMGVAGYGHELLVVFARGAEPCLSRFTWVDGKPGLEMVKARAWVGNGELVVVSAGGLLLASRDVSTGSHFGFDEFQVWV